MQSSNPIGSRVSVNAAAVTSMRTPLTLQVDADTAHLAPSFVQGTSSLTVQLKRTHRSSTVRLQDTVFTAALPSDTSIEVQSTALALQLLRSGDLSSRIWVLEERFSETAAMALSQSDAVLLFQRVEAGKVHIDSIISVDRENAEQILHRLVPIWILNQERAWTMRNAARHTVRALRHVGRFFRSILV